MNNNDIPEDLLPRARRPSATPQSKSTSSKQGVRPASGVAPVQHTVSGSGTRPMSRPVQAVPQKRTTSSATQPQAASPSAKRPATGRQTPPASGSTQRRAVSANAARANEATPSRAGGAHPDKNQNAGDTRTINRVNVNSKNAEAEEKASTVSNLVKAIIYIVVVVAVAGLLSYYIIMFGNDMYAFVKSDEEIEVSIPEYATVEEIADVLGDAGVVKYPSLLVLYAKLKKIDKTYEFVEGDYTVNGMMNYDELFYAFVKHKSYETVRITIPEGYTVDEIIKLMTENGIGTRKGFIDAINNYEFDFDFVRALDAADLSGRTYRLEGYLYPDTYEFYKSSSEATVIYKLLSRFNVIFAEEFYEKSQELGYSIDEIMTLASMIEKEGRYSVDYEQISSVFHNRLNSPGAYPYLESDATIMYAVQVRDGERKATLTSDDMNYDTPYNSYIYPGLPPGPIANPGYEAITCALYPAKTNYYFFVSDNYGNTYFSKTLAQHNEAKEKVRRINSEG